MLPLGIAMTLFYPDLAGVLKVLMRYPSGILGTREIRKKEIKEGPFWNVLFIKKESYFYTVIINVVLHLQKRN